MKDWWQFKQPGPVTGVLFMLAFGAVQLGPSFDVPNVALVGAGIAIAGVISAIADRRMWHALLCACFAVEGFTAVPRGWNATHPVARVMDVILLLFVLAAIVVTVLRAMGIMKPLASDDAGTQRASR